ncbi:MULTISPECIES: alpha-glutamyl/putrescinyl thymine pyrophosphorylase clade 3 protein [Corallococcus]|uniref:alpha-glutamyl/putrescinyl thymine pyrophosphorylase clade 3 protein n=1 Tax=Corallococcus TaxID=83461 RepID=UPI0011C44B36|nr:MULTISPECIES: hypothetical protein [Corallococcus]NPC53134.1 hypothetical protein [Corallococcus exiguus]NPD29118.1 hypothetical protein [Corallococcus exiguus]
MRPKDRQLAVHLKTKLRAFAAKTHPLPGVESEEFLASFVEQLVESVRRVSYIAVIQKQMLSSLRADPASESFDPIKAAVLRRDEGRLDEAFWLVFLSVHFGKNYRTGWRLARNVYGRLGQGAAWTWANTSSSPGRFRKWLSEYEEKLSDNKRFGCFGNHRRYQSLSAWEPRGTGSAFETYIGWIAPSQTHQAFFNSAPAAVSRDPKILFEYFYNSMAAVDSFGRLARFDYLTMVGKLGLAAIAPGRTYLQGATGPRRGAQLLFGGSVKAGLKSKDLEARLVELGAYLGVGMQELEDSLCNWQKSPAVFVPFRG